MDDPDDELIAFATRPFGLARAGQTEQLSAYLDAGVDANLANQKGDTLVMLAAAGADPRAGTPSAVATARMFERTDLLELPGAAGDEPGAGS